MVPHSCSEPAARDARRATMPRRVLLTEGSSLSAREAISALGARGHRLDLCDPDPRCLGRLSRFVRRVHRCPASGADPAAYVAFVAALLATGDYDVLLPVHEQAYLLAHAARALPPGVGVALAPAASFDCVQGKVAFVRTLARLGLPQPASRVATSRAELAELAGAAGALPCFVKEAYGTASDGVFRVDSRAALDRAAARLEARGAFADGVVVQRPARGALERAQGVFRAGALVGWHAYRQLAEGVNGGDVLKEGVLRAPVREHLAALGRALDWHGALSLDYFYDDADGAIAYVDANPRLVEPMNALYSGVDLTDLLVRVSLGEPVRGLRQGRPGVRTRLGLMGLLARAAREGSRPSVVREALAGMLGRGAYRGSREELTPPGTDLASAAAYAYVFGRLLAAPAAWRRIAGRSVASYALTPEAARWARDLPAGEYPSPENLPRFRANESEC